jgi:integrase
MGRPGRPWRRKPTNDWYAKIGGSQVRLAPASASFKDAEAEWVRIRATSGIASPGAKAPDLSVRDLCDLFLEDLAGAVERGERQQVTLDGYLRLLKTAAKAIGTMKAPDVQVRHVKGWIDGKRTWGATTRFNAITAIKAVFSWSRKQGYIEADPIRDMERPAPRRRIEVITPEQADQIMAAIPDRPFRELLTALRETGCRPGEAIGLTARGVNLETGIWSVINKTRAKTGEKTRPVYLTPEMVDLSRRLIVEWPEGPIFRNRRGNPWTRHATACRFADLRTKLGMGPEATAYAFRHLYITDALDRGVPVATVAELVGHTDTKMIMKIYSHLKERREHLREAARRARG